MKCDRWRYVIVWGLQATQKRSIISKFRVLYNNPGVSTDGTTVGTPLGTPNGTPDGAPDGTPGTTLNLLTRGKRRRHNKDTANVPAGVLSLIG